MTHFDLLDPSDHYDLGLLKIQDGGGLHLGNIKMSSYLSSSLTDSNQILHSDKDYQMPFEGGPRMRITNPRCWTAAILEKSIKIAISQQRFDRFDRSPRNWHFDAF